MYLLFYSFSCFKKKILKLKIKSANFHKGYELCLWSQTDRGSNIDSTSCVSWKKIVHSLILSSTSKLAVNIPTMHRVFIKVNQVHAPSKMLSTMSGTSSGNRGYEFVSCWMGTLKEEIYVHCLLRRDKSFGETSAKILCYQELDLPSLNKELHLRQLIKIHEVIITYFIKSHLKKNWFAKCPWNKDVITRLVMRLTFLGEKRKKRPFKHSSLRAQLNSFQKELPLACICITKRSPHLPIVLLADPK